MCGGLLVHMYTFFWNCPTFVYLFSFQTCLPHCVFVYDTNYVWLLISIQTNVVRFNGSIQMNSVRLYGSIQTNSVWLWDSMQKYYVQLLHTVQTNPVRLCSSVHKLLLQFHTRAGTMFNYLFPYKYILFGSQIAYKMLLFGSMFHTFFLCGPIQIVFILSLNLQPQKSPSKLLPNIPQVLRETCKKQIVFSSPIYSSIAPQIKHSKQRNQRIKN